MRLVLRLGVDPSSILFANPCKTPAALSYAQELGVTRTIFDNLDELDKIKTYLPDAELLLRIYANDDSALICFGDKFGAHLDTTPQLLARVRELGLNMIGVSFHVGEKDSSSFRASRMSNTHTPRYRGQELSCVRESYQARPHRLFSGREAWVPAHGA